MEKRFDFGRITGLTILAKLSNIGLCTLLMNNRRRGKTIAEVWDGEVLKLSCRRCVFERLMDLWYELLDVVENLNLMDDEDHIIRSHSLNGRFSVQSLCSH